MPQQLVPSELQMLHRYGSTALTSLGVVRAWTHDDIPALPYPAVESGKPHASSRQPVPNSASFASLRFSCEHLTVRA